MWQKKKTIFTSPMHLDDVFMTRIELTGLMKKKRFKIRLKLDPK